MENNESLTPKGEIIFCEHCGEALPSNSAFCKRCGRKVERDVKPSPQGHRSPVTQFLCSFVHAVYTVLFVALPYVLFVLVCLALCGVGALCFDRAELLLLAKDLGILTLFYVAMLLAFSLINQVVGNPGIRDSALRPTREWLVGIRNTLDIIVNAIERLRDRHWHHIGMIRVTVIYVFFLGFLAYLLKYKNIATHLLLAGVSVVALFCSFAILTVLIVLLTIGVSYLCRMFGASDD